MMRFHELPNTYNRAISLATHRRNFETVLMSDFSLMNGLYVEISKGSSSINIEDIHEIIDMK